MNFWLSYGGCVLATIAFKENAMRPYRAWDKERKCYISDSFLNQLYLRMDGRVIWWSHVHKFEDVTDKFDIEFCTGLTDKNGKDLDWWEGDVFEDAGILKVIVKDKGCFWFENVKSKRRIPCYEIAESSGCWAEEINKVGNIHEA